MFGRSRCRWENDVTMNFRDIVLEVVDWLHLAVEGTSGGVLWTRYWTFGFHDRREIS
jgi:hypothetical protein